MASLHSSRSLPFAFVTLTSFLLVSGASVTACGGGHGGGSGDGDGGTGGRGGLGGTGADSGDGDGDGDGDNGSGGMGMIDPDANVGDIRLLECGENSEGLQAQLYTQTGWHNQTECERPFLSKWDTALPGISTETQLKLPLVEEGTYDFWIDWGDETLEHITDWDAANTTHTYSEAGEYDVRVVGEWVGFRFGDKDPADVLLNDINWQDSEKLLEISQWGELSLGPVSGHFANAKNWQLVATDAPTLDQTTSLQVSFRDAQKLNADIGHWDTSKIARLYWTFYGATSFNGDIGDWDTSNVTNMFGTFQDALAFNGDISEWDTSQVSTIGQMFVNAAAFNQPIGTWNTSSLKELRATFHGAESFNQDLNDWDVSGVTEFFRTFRLATAFNGNINDWDVSSATTMYEMFYDAIAFNQDISGWDVSDVVNMAGALSGAASFNQPIGTWDVSNVTSMLGMFAAAGVFDQDLSAWQIPNVTTMEFMFNNSGISTNNYSKFLASCALQSPSIQNDVPLGALHTQHNDTASISRQKLINDHNWIITDACTLPNPECPNQ